MGGKPLFNLIVTHEPGYENYLYVREQLRDILGPGFRVVDTSQSVILARVDDPYEAVEKIRNELPDSTPLLRVIPVDAVEEPTVQRVAEKVGELASKIPVGESFRIRLDGHLYDDQGDYWRRLSRSEAIDIIAKRIDRPVNLSEPQWLVYIKIVRPWGGREYAAIMVAPPRYVFSIHRRR